MSVVILFLIFVNASYFLDLIEGSFALQKMLHNLSDTHPAFSSKYLYLSNTSFEKRSLLLLRFLKDYTQEANILQFE